MKKTIKITKYQRIAVMDYETSSIYLYLIPSNWDCEQIERFIEKKGHHLSSCSWGDFNGEIYS